MVQKIDVMTNLFLGICYPHFLTNWAAWYFS